MTLLLAHMGPGSTWQAPVALLSLLVAALFLLMVARVVKVRELTDLIVPFAAIALASALASASTDFLSDQVGWAIPLGVVGLGGVLWFAARPQKFGRTSPATIGIVVVAATASLALSGPLTNTLHPPPVFVDVTNLPVADDISVTILTPQLGETLAGPGPFLLQVEIQGGTVGELVTDVTDAPEDPEELGVLRVFNGATLLQVVPRETCSRTSPCTTVTWDIDLEPGTHTLVVEFLTATGSTFRTSVFATTIVTVE